MSEVPVGRFAPTPSGPLHFGSIIAALASYIVARQARGRWLIRIEDLDPPREMPGAASQILQTLEKFGFDWDGEVLYQSQRQHYYRETLERLTKLGVTYFCDCSRRLVQLRNKGIYDGFCRSRQLSNSTEQSIRIRFDSDNTQFVDHIFGLCEFNSAEDQQDFVIKRRDGLFAYQLAVVADDLYQGVNQVVRGADILDSTPRQNFIYQCLNNTQPAYYHLPLALDEQGEKLSKSKFSSAISSARASHYLCQALEHLGQSFEPDLVVATPEEILTWSIANFDIQQVGLKPKAYSE